MATQMPRPVESSTLTLKQQLVMDALADCLKSATENPPAEKPTLGPEMLLPTPIPPATPTVSAGVRHEEVMPAGGRFIPTAEGLNVWEGLVDGNVVAVTGGWFRDLDEDWGQLLATGVAPRRQGAVYVYVNHGQKVEVVVTPTRSGALHFLAACDLLLVLQAEDGTIFTFDAGTLTYVENSAACPAPGE